VQVTQEAICMYFTIYYKEN